jgi:hypothetical protein
VLLNHNNKFAFTFLTGLRALGTCWRGGGVAPRILCLGTGWGGAVGRLRAPAALPPGRGPLVHIGWEAGWM